MYSLVGDAAGKQQHIFYEISHPYHHTGVQILLHHHLQIFLQGRSLLADLVDAQFVE